MSNDSLRRVTVKDVTEFQGQGFLQIVEMTLSITRKLL